MNLIKRNVEKTMRWNMDEQADCRVRIEVRDKLNLDEMGSYIGEILYSEIVAITEKE